MAVSPKALSRHSGLLERTHFSSTVTALPSSIGCPVPYSVLSTGALITPKTSHTAGSTEAEAESHPALVTSQLSNLPGSQRGHSPGTWQDVVSSAKSTDAYALHTSGALQLLTDNPSCHHQNTRPSASKHHGTSAWFTASEQLDQATPSVPHEQAASHNAKAAHPYRASILLVPTMFMQVVLITLKIHFN